MVRRRVLNTTNPVTKEKNKVNGICKRENEPKVGFNEFLTCLARARPNNNLLRAALEDEHRRRHGLNVLFADDEKRPTSRSWKRWQTKPQTDDDVRCLYQKGASRITCYGYVTGFNGLFAIDFDAMWIYRLWMRRFGDRAKNLTIATPNNGARPYYLSEKSVTENKFKETLHVELEGPGRARSHGGLGS